MALNLSQIAKEYFVMGFSMEALSVSIAKEYFVMGFRVEALSVG